MRKILKRLRALAVAVVMASFPVARGGAANALPALAGSDWISAEPGCDIHEISFTAETAVLTLAWDSVEADWTLAGPQIRFELHDVDGKLAGTLTADNELALSFDWKTADYMPHSARCAMRRKAL